MSTRRPKAVTVIPSILDRLLDDEPANARDAPRSRHHDLRQLKEAVARDLEALLNTRREALDDLPASFEHVGRSLVHYGVPDFTSYGLANPDDRNAIRRELEAAISTHETRLQRVRVVLEAGDGASRELRFRVDAILTVAPAREPVRFDALLHVTTQQYTIRDGDWAKGVAP